MDIKVEINEESCFLDFYSQNETDLFTKDLVKSETVTSGNECDIHIKTENKEQTVDSNFYSLNEREFFSGHPVIRFNTSSRENEIETKIEVKEEQWCIERTTETACIYDNIQHATDERFYSIKSPSVYKEGVSSCTADLFSSEELGNDRNFNMIETSPECESSKKCQSQESDLSDISSVVMSICTEGKIFTKPSCLEQNNLLQQSNSNKLDLTKENSKTTVGYEYKKLYKCHVCEKSFKYPSELKSHKLIHEGIKPHKCNICNDAFAELSNLKKHILTHEDIKPHKCDNCSKAFTLLSTLKRHILTHESIKPKKCNICNKIFTKLSSLKTHKLTHEGIKPHKCNICGKAFTQLSSLRRHTLTHEGIKPHKCKICNNTFTRLSSLIRHRLIHEDIEANS